MEVGELINNYNLQVFQLVQKLSYPIFLINPQLWRNKLSFIQIKLKGISNFLSFSFP